MSIYEYDEERQRRFDREEGEERFAELISHLLEDDRVSDLRRAAEDKEFRQHLYKEIE